MFVLKKLVSALLVPLSVVVELLLAGLVLLWFTKQQRAAKVVTTVGVAALILASTGIVSNSLLVPLERKYPPFRFADTRLEPDSGAPTYVVVLGGGHVSDPRLPATSQIGAVPLVRLVEGIRIHRLLAGSRLIVSGGAVSDPVPQAHIMRTIALELGVADSSIVIEDQSRDTRHEAVLIAPIVGSRPFVLVTSASHMPRSMAMFRGVGTHPIPAPVGHGVRSRGGVSYSLFLPAVRHLQGTSMATHEYLGLLWGKLRGFF